MKKILSYLSEIGSSLLAILFALYFYGFIVLIINIHKEDEISDKDFAIYSTICMFNLFMITFTFLLINEIF